MAEALNRDRIKAMLVSPTKPEEKLFNDFIQQTLKANYRVEQVIGAAATLIVKGLTQVETPARRVIFDEVVKQIQQVAFGETVSAPSPLDSLTLPSK